ncbi:LAQU0S04e01442g1_1 [Lachancea quebecensis]|uniref:LAQU0S04e01442g1_1 n=1 Tax=Lachancea quebecensis TaxID=1654605 RepID=A0A0P1KPS4_9SACH|nr:LAQU0S04e01442g1_1 [Lachancea quebecensis]
MWILRYQYIDETGSEVRVSCCLKIGTQYVVGRSVKSPLQIKGDKSISRKHVQLEVEQNSMLKILNAGKLTKICGGNVKVDQVLEFGVDQNVTLEMGAGPVKGTITHESTVWKIPHDLAITENLKNHLSLYNIQITNSLTSKTSIQIIKEHQSSYGNCLFALVKKIPIFFESFIGDFVSQFTDIHIDFDARWKQVTMKNTPFPKHQTKDAVFKGLNFVVINQKSFAIYKSIIDAGSGNLWLCDDISSLGAFIEQQIKSESVVILIHLVEEGHKIASEQKNSVYIQEAKLLKSKARSLGLKIYDVNDVVDAVLKDNIQGLLDRVPQEKALEENLVLESNVISRTLADKATDASSLRNKRKRANRQIRPLDSLAFFGGGSSLSQNAEKVHVPAEKQSVALQEDLEGHTDSGEHQLSKKPRKELVVLYTNEKKLPNSSENPIYQGDQIDFKPSSERETPSEISKENKPAYTEKLSKAPTGPAEDGRAVLPPSIQKHNLKGSHIPSSEANNNDNVDHTDHDVQAVKRPRSLIRAFQEAKLHEVDRLKKNMADVGSEELTEEAINMLDNLASVEKVDLMRKPNETIENTNQRISTNPQWAKRKNFKKFVKLWPSHSSRSSPDNVSDAIRNKAYLITRDYVSLRPFDGARDNNVVDEFDDAIEQHVTAEQPSLTTTSGSLAALGVEVENEPTFAFQSQRGATLQTNLPEREANSRWAQERGPERDQELFVVDEDDSQSQTMRFGNSNPEFASRLEESDQKLQLNEQGTPKAAPPKTSAPHESDDSDDEPQFRFQSRR